MASTAVMASLDMATRAGEVDGWSFQMGSRPRWQFVLRISDIGAGITALSVAIQTSPRDLDEDYTTAKTLGPYTSADNGSEVTVDTEAATPDDITIPATANYWRAIVTGFAGVGNYDLEAIGRAPFLDPQRGQDVDPLPKRLRTFTDGLGRIVEGAEATVLDRLLGRTDIGRVLADLTRADALRRIRDAIRFQAQLDFQKEELGRSQDATSQVSLRKLPNISDDAREVLEPLAASATSIWMGR